MSTDSVDLGEEPAFDLAVEGRKQGMQVGSSYLVPSPERRVFREWLRDWL